MRRDMKIGEVISEDAYLRERLTPAPGEQLYLHLADLRLAMQRAATAEPLAILDFGSGGSPYRSFFPHAQYTRADIAGTPNVDYIIPTAPAELRLALQDERFDLILSNQVLEHLPSPVAYLAECLRLLKYGGQLVCSTHGSFEDHGCPYDYQRWTAAGLRMLLEESGFEVTDVLKLTTGPRALFFTLDYFAEFLTLSRRTSIGAVIYLLKRILLKRRRDLHRMLDARYSQNRVVADGDPSGFYIGLFAAARRPAR